MANPFIIPAQQGPSFNVRPSPLSQGVTVRANPGHVDFSGLASGIKDFGEQRRIEAERQRQIDALRGSNAPDDIMRLAQVDPKGAARAFAGEASAARQRAAELDFARSNDPFYGRAAEELSAEYGLSPEEASLASSLPGAGMSLMQARIKAEQRAKATENATAAAIEREERKLQLKQKMKRSEEKREQDRDTTFFKRSISEISDIASGDPELLEQRLGVVRGTKAYNDFQSWITGGGPPSETLKARLDIEANSLEVGLVKLLSKYFRPITENEAATIAAPARAMTQAKDARQYFELLKQFQSVAMRHMGVTEYERVKSPFDRSPTEGKQVKLPDGRVVSVEKAKTILEQRRAAKGAKDNTWQEVY